LDLQDLETSEKLIRTFLTELSTSLLLALSDMVSRSRNVSLNKLQGNAIQALPTIRSPADQSLFNSPADAGQELKRPASVGPGGLQQSPSSSNLRKSNRNTISNSQNPSSENLTEKRVSSKGRGRVLKVLADLNLLCGVIPGAISLYTQSVEILRLTTDHIWHASALEGVGIALVLLAYLKVEYSVLGH
jgi:Transport protein Trs120 or TRAPPC9, TRAPP II complex subunit